MSASNFENILDNLCEMTRQFLSINEIVSLLSNMIVKLKSIEINERTSECIGCIEEQPNQLAHMDVGGCMYDINDIV